MTMPFGKHKGEDIEDLPDSYLLWLAENISEDDFEAVCLAADKEYRFREKHDSLGENP